MKIGILTFHCSYNFGAVLQCYALQEYIKSLGHDVKILNYRPSYLTAKEPKINIKYIVKHPFSVFSYIVKHYPLRKRRYVKFMEFEEQYYQLTELLYLKDDIEECIKEFEVIVFGSDQIWCEKFNKKDSVWFGNLKHDKNVKFISYAASAGDVVFSNVGEEMMKEAVEAFKAISVREKKLADYIKEKTEIVLDPTLMVPEKVYEKWLKPIVNDRYILVRQARNDSYIYKLAKEIAKQMNAKVITADMHSNSFKDSEEVIPCSPSEFVALVKNAQCVISNSFHGIAIALVTKVPFYATRLYDGGDERILNLLGLLDLTDRIVEQGERPKFKDINYKSVTEKLDVLRKNSQQFLIQNLS
ncbi:MAG: polysaccharide pyruvyl transferase family protein [Prevotella sp.]|nr:polysaccharide pyruvyl transferase family protein [Prevotella sp.]